MVQGNRLLSNWPSQRGFLRSTVNSMRLTLVRRPLLHCAALLHDDLSLLLRDDQLLLSCDDHLLLLSHDDHLLLSHDHLLLSHDDHLLLLSRDDLLLLLSHDDLLLLSCDDHLLLSHDEHLLLSHDRLLLSHDDHLLLSHDHLLLLSHDGLLCHAAVTDCSEDVVLHLNHTAAQCEVSLRVSPDLQRLLNCHPCSITLCCAGCRATDTQADDTFKWPQAQATLLRCRTAGLPDYLC